MEKNWINQKSDVISAKSLATLQWNAEVISQINKIRSPIQNNMEERPVESQKISHTYATTAISRASACRKKKRDIAEKPGKLAFKSAK